MRYNIISAKDSIPDYINSLKRFNHSKDPVGIIYCEGPTAYHYMMSTQRPGNYSFEYGSKIPSQFTEFKRTNGGGIGCGTETTCILVEMGIVDNNNVLFVYPTSIEVNHKEIEDYFKKHFPNLFFIEFDINFSAYSLERKIKEKEKNI